MSHPECETALAKLIRGLGAPKWSPITEASPEFAALGDPLTAEFIRSFLLWRSGPRHAARAMKRIVGEVVDFNELRIWLADELAELFGEQMPHAEERAIRLKLSLNDIYQREHATSLARLEPIPKRDARVYLDSLDSVPPYVAARVFLLCLGGHAFPLDEPLAEALTKASALPPDQDLQTAGGWLERQFRAGDAHEAYLKIEGWAASRGRTRSSSTRTKAGGRSGRSSKVTTRGKGTARARGERS